MTTIAYIGLGIMGKPAALNLIKGGHQLHIFARKPVAVEPLVEAGAKAFNSPAEAAKDAEFAFTNVSNGPDVEEVILADNGIAKGMQPGGIIIDMSTIAPSIARQIANKLIDYKIDFIDAPVSGGEVGAINATLAFMCGGKQEVFERALPILKLMGGSFVLVGDSGAGQVAKINNQVIIAGTVNAIAEAFRLSKLMGVDPSKVREAISGGFADSKVLQIHAKRMIDSDYTPGFKTKLHRKDLGIALDAATEANTTLPQTKRFVAQLDKAIANGKGEMDSSIASTELSD